MTGRAAMIAGKGAALVWALGLLSFAAMFVPLPVFTLMPTIMTAFFAPGLVMAAMVLRIAQRRMVAEQEGGALSEAGEIDRRVLANTTEQLVLALAIWPAAAVMLGPQGPGVIVSLGIGFALMRLVFWWGYHRAPWLRGFGFAATFYPTVLVALWGIWRLVT